MAVAPTRISSAEWAAVFSFEGLDEPTISDHRFGRGYRAWHGRDLHHRRGLGPRSPRFDLRSPWLHRRDCPALAGGKLWARCDPAHISAFVSGR